MIISIASNKQSVTEYEGTPSQLLPLMQDNCFSLKKVDDDDINSEGTLVLTDNIQSLSQFAFRDNTRLTNIKIPSSVSYIGAGAFYGCSNLLEITVPESVELLGFSVFEACTSLKTIKLSSKLAKSILVNEFSILNDASDFTMLSRCSSLEKIYINASDDFITALENNSDLDPNYQGKIFKNPLFDVAMETQNSVLSRLRDLPQIASLYAGQWRDKAYDFSGLSEELLGYINSYLEDKHHPILVKATAKLGNIPLPSEVEELEEYTAKVSAVFDFYEAVANDIRKSPPLIKSSQQAGGSGFFAQPQDIESSQLPLSTSAITGNKRSVSTSKEDTRREEDYVFDPPTIKRIRFAL